MLDINKDIIYCELMKRIEAIFLLKETYAVKIRDIVIEKTQNIEQKQSLAKQAVDICYHDVLSDIDLAVIVKIPPEDCITTTRYMNRIDRYGITKDNYLGLTFVSESNMYRIILQNGMRYDFGFQFIYDEQAENIDLTENSSTLNDYDNERWPLKNIDRFWFMQVHALAKLYRNDFLIGDHLANTSINETLVQQMVLRDIKYGTKFHRYGYQEVLDYLQVDGIKCPYRGANQTFNMIAEKIYSTAIVYDQLSFEFYPQHKERKDMLFTIWDCYKATLCV